jgi:hypothetical protein
MGRESIVIGMVKIVGYKVGGFQDDVDVFWGMTFQRIGCGDPECILCQ